MLRMRCIHGGCRGGGAATAHAMQCGSVPSSYGCLFALLDYWGRLFAVAAGCVMPGKIHGLCTSLHMLAACPMHPRMGCESFLLCHRGGRQLLCSKLGLNLCTGKCIRQLCYACTPACALLRPLL
jgi:hypothetical protein